MGGNKDSASSCQLADFFGRGARGARCSSNTKSFIFTVDLYATIAAEIATPPQNAPSRTCMGYGSTSSSGRDGGESSTGARSATKKSLGKRRADEHSLLCTRSYGQYNRNIFHGSFSTSAAEPLDQTSSTLSVPDPDSRFNRERTQESFGEEQVWAAYDDKDRMPRYYAKIRSVGSSRPSTLQIWLTVTATSNTELWPVNWISFVSTKHVVNSELTDMKPVSCSILFHTKLSTTRDTRCNLHISQKGDVWALYKNWSPDWNRLTAEEVIRKYDIVEVDEFDKKLGTRVIPLAKAAGFRTVFRQDRTNGLWAYRRQQMFRFSHQVPGYLLTGEESPNEQTVHWALDPAALPPELLQVVIDING